MKNLKNFSNSTKSVGVFITLFILVGILIAATFLIKSFIGYLLILLMTSYLFIFITRKNNVFLFKIILFGFSLRFLLSIVNAYIWILPSGRNDALNFEYSGWVIANSVDSLMGIFSIEVEFYRKFIALVYFVTDRNPLLIQHFSVISGTLLIYIVYKIVLQLSSSPKSAKIAAFIIAIYPGLVQFSVFTRRESLIYFFTALSVYIFLKWFNKGKNSDFLKALILLVIASIFHSGVIFIGTVYLFFYIFYKPLTQSWNISMPKILISIILFTTILSFGDVVFRKIPELSITEIEETVSRKSLGGRTGYLQDIQPNSVSDFIVQTPVRIIFFLLTPFPWQISTLTDIYGFVLDTLPMYLLLFYSYIALTSVKKRNKKMYIMLVALLILLIIPFAWGTSNYGTAIRHRQKIIWFLVALGSIGYVIKKEYKSRLITNRNKQKINVSQYSKLKAKKNGGI